MKLGDAELLDGHRAALQRGRPAPHPREGWRRRAFVVIFEADTAAGKAFDVALLITILISVAVVMLESVPAVRASHGFLLRSAEWCFTLVFLTEYVLRLLCVRRPLHYARSFFGVIDLLSILPTFLSLVFPGAQQLLTIRSLRLLRMFRIFKLARYLGEAESLMVSLRAAWAKIVVFLATVVILVVIVGSMMNLIEGSGRFNRGPLLDETGSVVLDARGEPRIVNRPTPGYDSIPSAMYWAIVTVSTVGYGDITPRTAPGKMVASLLILVGYSLIIVPTGVLSAELARTERARPVSSPPPQGCASCAQPLPAGAA